MNRKTAILLPLILSGCAVGFTAQPASSRADITRAEVAAAVEALNKDGRTLVKQLQGLEARVQKLEGGPKKK